MRAFALLLRKDVRLLRRAPALLLVLVVYPVLVALLVTLALQSNDRRPAIAVVVQDTSGRTVAVGDERLGIDDYVARLSEDVDVRRLDAAAAKDALDAGRVTAVLTIPEGFISDLQSGVRQPVLSLDASRRTPIEADAVVRNLESAVYRLNQRLAAGYVDQVLRLVDLVLKGGELGAFGRSTSALGLVNSRQVVIDLQAQLRADGRSAEAAKLDPILAFIDDHPAQPRPRQARGQRDPGPHRPLGHRVAGRPRAPVGLRLRRGAAGEPRPGGDPPRRGHHGGGARGQRPGAAGPRAGLGVGAGRAEDGLRGGRVPGRSGWCCWPAWPLFTSVEVGRWALWLPALVLSGLAFGALGVLAGALARETRTALLVALMVALPLLALALLPGVSAAAAISALVPFGPAFDAFQTLLVEPTVSGGDLARTLGHLALLGAVFGVASALVVRRRAAG